MSLAKKMPPPVPFVSLGFKDESVLKHTYNCRPAVNHQLTVWWNGWQYVGMSRHTLPDGTTRDRRFIRVDANVTDLLMVQAAILEYIKLKIPRPIGELFQRGIWRDKEGLEHPIEEMETDHIQKCILLIRHHPTLWRQRYLPLLEGELNRRARETRDLKHG